MLTFPSHFDEEMGERLSLPNITYKILKSNENNANYTYKMQSALLLLPGKSQPELTRHGINLQNNKFR